VNLTTIAAFIAAGAGIVAAGVSLIGVAMTARLSRASQRQEWRRAHVLPVAAEFLAREETITRKLTWGLGRLKEGHEPSTDLAEEDLAEEVDRLVLQQ
jgi:hypothetical protein